jgi:hypothetical protein
MIESRRSKNSRQRTAVKRVRKEVDSDLQQDAEGGQSFDDSGFAEASDLGREHPTQQDKPLDPAERTKP